MFFWNLIILFLTHSMATVFCVVFLCGVCFLFACRGVLGGWAESAVSGGILDTRTCSSCVSLLALKPGSSHYLLPDDFANPTRYMAQSLVFAKTYSSLYVSSSASTNVV